MRGRKPAAIVAGSSPVNSVPKAPAWLSADARKEWKRTAQIMVERKTLTEGDLAALEAFCVAVATVRECQRALAADGMFVTNAKGDVKRHPAAGTMDAASKTLRLYASELGLTPVSRSRPAIRDDDKSGELDFLG